MLKTIEDITFNDSFYKVERELNLKHNHPLFTEIQIRNRLNLSAEAIWYKGKGFSYSILFEKVNIYAKALLALGYRKGDEVVVCFSNIPQFIFLFLAVSKIGAIINSVGEWFDDEYYCDIFEHSKSVNFFCSENHKSRFENILENQNIKIWSFTINNSEMTLDEEYFELLAKECDADEHQQINLSDPFTVTYTSGTTNPGRPKAVLHAVRSYMFLARYKDADVSGMPEMKNTRIFSHIPFYVHASLSTSVVDPLFQGCCIVLEQEYSADRFPLALFEGKPNQVFASVGFWLKLADFLEHNSDVDMSFLYVPTVSGEGLSIGEEKYLNHIAKKYKFGCAKFPFNIIPVTFSIGGGTTESSGVLVTLFKNLQEKRVRYRRYNSLGLKILGCSCVCVLDDDKNILDYGIVGTAWIAGPCNMLKYYYDDERMESIRFTDKKGREWIKMEAASIMQDNTHLKIVGRKNDFISLQTNEKIPFFLIENKLYLEIPELMSCNILEMDNCFVFHLKNRLEVASDIEQSIQKVQTVLTGIGLNKCTKDVYVSFHDSKLFELAPSGKRDINALRKCGIKDAIKLF